VTDTDLDTIAELTAYIAHHAADIPEHRRRQAVIGLERVERLIPLPDDEADDLEPQETT